MSRSLAVRTRRKVRAQYTLAARRPKRFDESVHRKRRALAALGYPAEELAHIPSSTIEQTFACGNPLVTAAIRPGDVVLDLGSGAGLDCLLLANRLAGGTRVVGLDITPAMAARALRTAAAAGKDRVQFGVGDAQALPLANATANVVVSNGVICLTEDKERVFREAFRVLQQGGRLTVTDLLHTGPRLARHLGYRLCGAVTPGSPDDYRAMVARAGFEDIVIHSRRAFRIEEAASLWGVRPFVRFLIRLGSRRLFRAAANRLLRGITSIHLTAVKPSSVEESSLAT